MIIEKVYSKSAIIIKVIFSLMLAPMYVLFSSFMNIEDGFLHIILSVVPIACLYTLPYWVSLVYIKKYPSPSIGKYILFDSVSCLIPAFFGILITEIIITVINGKTLADGITTLIFTVIFAVISLIFWLLYFIFSKMK